MDQKIFDETIAMMEKEHEGYRNRMVILALASSLRVKIIESDSSNMIKAEQHKILDEVSQRLLSR